MAKGDKKKKSDKTILEASSSKFLADESASTVVSSVVSEPQVVGEESGQEDTDLVTSSFSSLPPLTDKQLERSEDELHQVPVLSNIIIRKYEGEKCRERFHGEGVAYFQGGHVYKGMFSEGIMHGRGLYTWADGVKYEGEFVSNVPLGHGTYTWLDGSCYEGEVFNGIRHGVGTYRCANAAVVYRGQWDHSKRHGKGTIYYNQEMSSWYDGDWVDNNREGWGVRCYPSGNTYEGQWRSNVRHGEGKMRWLHLEQEYSGTWEDGVQHGQGRHTWYLRRVHGSQYPLRNEYRGQFALGLRHGEGSFYYASGALYKGQWKGDKKHGQGKFIFKNGRVFEGEFVHDHMAEFPTFCLDGSKTPDLSGIRTHTPRPEDVDSPRRLSQSGGGSDDISGPMGSDIALDISALLEKLPESRRGSELKQLEFAVLRHIAELRSIYSFYSSLGHGPSPESDNTFLLTRLQLWRLLKDCSGHADAITLAQADRYVADEDVPPEEIHSPFSTMLLRKFLSCVVVLAYHTYHKDIEASGHTPVLVACFSKLMNESIIPNAKTVKGLLFSHPVRAVVAVNYIDRCWEIYQAFCSVSHAPTTGHAHTADHSPTADHAHTADHTMTIRHFIWMFKDLGLFDAKLTTRRLLEIISTETPAAYSQANCNLDLEMTFLEFFEALLGCAEVKGHQAGEGGVEGEAESSPQANTGRVTHEEDRQSPPQATQRPSPLTGATVKSSNHVISPAASSPKSAEVGQKEVLRLSSPEELEARRSPKAAAKPRSQAEDLAGGSATRSSDAERREEPSGAAAVANPASNLEAELSNHPPQPHSREPGEEAGVGGGGGAGAEGDVEAWIQRSHRFFSLVFYPAYDLSLLLRRQLQEDRLRREACARIDLAKAKEQARLREQWEAEEEERRKEEEEDEEAEGQESDQTPVASTTSVAVHKQPPSAAGTKKKKK